MTPPTTAAVVVTYNSGPALAEMLASKQIVEAFDTLLVVDNASEDDSRQVASDAGVDLLRRPRNDGLAAALNDGLRQTESDYLVVINPDISFDGRSTVDALVRYLERDERLGLVAPQLSLPNGKVQDSARAVPTPAQLVMRRLMRRDLGVINVTKSAYVPWVVLAFVVIRRRALEQIGGFDEDYFLYFEDVQLCVDLWKAGWRVIQTAEVVADHAHAAESRSGFRSAANQHHRHSALRFFRKNPSAVLGHHPAHRSAKAAARDIEEIA